MTGAIIPLTLPGRITQSPDTVPRPAVAVPLALPLLRTASPGSLYFGTARMDSSGRVHDRSAVAVLGWLPGDRLMITVVETSVVYQRRAEGVFAMTAKPYVVVPAPVRARCGLLAGSRVLVAVDPGQDALVVHPAAAVAAMLSHFHAQLAGGGHA
jgi:bifunctional DNA-binding transcriptional regulator/antitoxin component of YhaV-PrlF toxin-antitoxin module